MRLGQRRRKEEDAEGFLERVRSLDVPADEGAAAAASMAMKLGLRNAAAFQREETNDDDSSYQLGGRLWLL